LPVVGFDTGSLREIVGRGGLIVPYRGDPWRLEPPANPDALLDGIRTVAADWRTYSDLARREAETRFDIQAVAREYLEVLAG
jgi:glycosyltransferase involved in cell wall biosynthesis